MPRSPRIVVVVALASALLAGCVAYQPVPVAAPTFDRAWNAALGGAQEWSGTTG